MFFSSCRIWKNLLQLISLTFTLRAKTNCRLVSSNILLNCRSHVGYLRWCLIFLLPVIMSSELKPIGAALISSIITLKLLLKTYVCQMAFAILRNIIFIPFWPSTTCSYSTHCPRQDHLTPQTRFKHGFAFTYLTFLYYVTVSSFVIAKIAFSKSVLHQHKHITILFFMASFLPTWPTETDRCPKTFYQKSWWWGY